MGSNIRVKFRQVNLTGWVAKMDKCSAGCLISLVTPTLTQFCTNNVHVARKQHFITYDWVAVKTAKMTNK